MIKVEYSIMTGMNIYSDLREETLDLRKDHRKAQPKKKRRRKRR